MRFSLWAAGALVAALIVAAVSVRAAQSTSTQPTAASTPQPAVDPLLAEVRALRADFRQVSGISVRTQLLIARLQLQEQRLNSVAVQLNDIRKQIEIKEGAEALLTEKLKRFEEAMRSPTASPEVARDLEGQLPDVRAALAQMKKERVKLRAHEGEIANQLATEESRWLDFNSRLDDLEKLLPINIR